MGEAYSQPSSGLLYGPPSTPGGAGDEANHFNLVAVRLTALGFDPVGSTPEELGQQFKREVERYAKVIKAANIQAE